MLNNFLIKKNPSVIARRHVARPAAVSYLSGQCQEVAVELHVGHDLCQIFIVLHVFVELQEHAVTAQHERHLLLDDSAGKGHVVRFPNRGRFLCPETDLSTDPCITRPECQFQTSWLCFVWSATKQSSQVLTCLCRK